jgi:hypothetical protein
MSIIHRYIMLYRVSDGFKDFIMTCFVNRWANPYRYHLCDYCQHVVIKKPLFVGAWHAILRKPRYCNRCASAFNHVRMCHKSPCWICDREHEYLTEERSKATATRLLRDVKLERVVLFGPND